MGGPLLTLAPRRLQAGGEAIEIDCDGLRPHRRLSAAIDPLAEFGLSRADLSKQRHRIGSGAELSQPGPWLLRRPENEQARDPSAAPADSSA